MKKMILAAALLAATATTAVAQEEFAPEAGDFSVEVQFNPFSNDFGTFKLDQLKGRYFFTGKDALRFGIGFGVDNAKLTPEPDATDYEAWGKAKTGNFSINLGYERHFFNYKRVDLYAGAGLGFAMQRVKAEEFYSDEDGDVKEQVINAFDADNTGDFSARSWSEFNLKVFTGIDFYVYKGLFVGAELGIKFGARNYPGVYTKGGYTDNGNFDEKIESDKFDKANSISLTTYVEPALRLGWTF